MTGKLLILGAGASFGSEQEKQYAPPLGAVLFQSLLEFSPESLGNIPQSIRAIFNKDFEAGMLALAQQLPQMLPVLQRCMGAFFFRFGPTPNSLYLRLARQLKGKSWDGAIATLNYERMLTMALGQSGIQTWCGDKTTASTGIEICLPHGICNLFCESVRGMASAVAMAGMQVTTNGPVLQIENPDQFWDRIRNDAFPPVMSYFEPSKFTTSGSDFIAAQRNRLLSLIQQASSIAVIGIQVREADTHIWNSLAGANANIAYCAGPEGAATYQRWQTKFRPSAHDVVMQGFWSDDFDKILAHLGIA